MKQKLLTIIIPTYNRATILPQTLLLFKSQIKRNEEDVELIVCNNASTDETAAVLNTFHSLNPFFSVVNYQSHADVGVSILRSSENGNGMFIVLFGDDDIPFPYFVDTLLDKCKTYSSYGAIVYNRIQGDDYDKEKFSNVSIYNNEYSATDLIYKDSSVFIENYYKEMSFLSISCLQRSAWVKGKRKYTNYEIGYEFLTPMLYGISGEKCVYLSYPLCCQRHPRGNKVKSAWLDRYALFAYVGMPRVLKKMEELKVIRSNWRDCYKKKYEMYLSDSTYLHYLQRMANNITLYRPYLEELLELPLSKELSNLTRILLGENSMAYKRGRILLEIKLYGKKKFVFSKVLSILKELSKVFK